MTTGYSNLIRPNNIKHEYTNLLFKHYNIFWPICHIQGARLIKKKKETKNRHKPCQSKRNNGD
jgi:hypothetical protein